MTREEIIEMARQAGFLDYELDDGTTNAFDVRYEAFARLVAEHERKECAVAAEKESLRGLPEEQPEGEELLRACAQIAGGVLIADVIRARGNHD